MQKELIFNYFNHLELHFAPKLIIFLIKILFLVDTY